MRLRGDWYPVWLYPLALVGAAVVLVWAASDIRVSGGRDQ